jgi:hypothetical protein
MLLRSDERLYGGRKVSADAIGYAECLFRRLLSFDLLQMEKASRNVKPFYSPHNVYNSRDQQARCLTATS